VDQATGIGDLLAAGEPALLRQEQDGGGGKHLGKRSDVKEGGGDDGYVVIQVSHPAAARVDDASFAEDR
jgi:hypothetical protein